MQTALLDVAIEVARWGALNALALAGLGLAVALLGERAQRPIAGAVAGAATAWASAYIFARWLDDSGLPKGMFVAAVAVGFLIAGLLAPTAGVVAAVLSLGFVVADALLANAPKGGGSTVVAVLIGASILASLGAGLFARYLSSLVGGLAMALGAWAYVGASGLSPALFRLTTPWVALGTVFVVIAAALEHGRVARARTRGDARHAKAERAAREQKAREDKERFDRYMQ